MHLGIPNLRWRGKRSWHSRRMHSPQFYVSGKRPMEAAECSTKYDMRKHNQKRVNVLWEPLWLVSAISHWRSCLNISMRARRCYIQGWIILFPLAKFLKGYECLPLEVLPSLGDDMSIWLVVIYHGIYMFYGKMHVWTHMGYTSRKRAIMMQQKHDFIIGF